MELRDYQDRTATQGIDIIQRLGLLYLAMEVRTGKTLTALSIADRLQCKRVLFLTKKKAIASIQSDYEKLKPEYEIVITNDEAMHLVEGDFCLVIHDEHHRFGAFPRPGAKSAVRQFKKRFHNLPMIFLSGTPTPESWSQIYHQFWVSDRSPFIQKTFYKWALKYVTKKKKYLGHGIINDYSKADLNKIKPLIEPYMIYYTQAQAGFKSEINENILRVQMNPETVRACELLKRDRTVQGKYESITADTAVALQQKLHQLWSGTIIFDGDEKTRTRKVLDDTKAQTIKERWGNEKIGIFYCFTEELNAIKSVLGDRITTDIAEFKSTDKSIALQIVSGREGVNLSEASAIVFYNISFSATSYWQGRDRMTTSDRRSSDIYWLFANGGIEEKIYAAVCRKKNYTIALFKKDYRIGTSRKNIKAA
jgi:hypothetical protein